MTISELRHEMGLSQSKFAAYFGLPVRSLQQWEQGRRDPPPYLLALMQRVWSLEKQLKEKG